MYEVKISKIIKDKYDDEDRELVFLLRILNLDIDETIKQVMANSVSYNAKSYSVDGVLNIVEEQ